MIDILLYETQDTKGNKVQNTHVKIRCFSMAFAVKSIVFFLPIITNCNRFPNIVQYRTAH